jgi:choline dehydrogenase-like flavoprotein
MNNGASHDYGYKTVPQKELGGREIPYARGKGLGGSSAINICVWDYGSKEELNEWARLVGDDVWRWENSLERIKKVRCSYPGIKRGMLKLVHSCHNLKIENVHNNTPPEYEKYVQLDPDSHGKHGYAV